MNPLSLDDLIPLDEYAANRAEHASAAARYLDRYRRVRVGPRLTLVFENRQTLWFRFHELLRVARLSDPLRVQQELDWYNRLLPDRGRLQAALHIDIPEGPEWPAQTRFWRNLPGSALQMQLGSLTCPARLVTCRPEDRCFGADHWVEFALTEEARAALGDRRQTVCIAADYSDYRHQSGPLIETVRRSLLDDLALAGREQAA